MKIVVTGATGFLGSRVAKVLEENHDVFRMGRKEADISSYKAVRRYMTYIQPDVVIHCAAIGDIHKCEKDQEMAYRVNVIGTKNIASVCADLDARLICISSDQVYDFKGHDLELREYVQTNPLNFYGKTKVLGENEVRNHVNKYFILRISWQYGWKEEGLPNSRDGLVESLDQALKRNVKVTSNPNAYQYITYVYDTIDVIIGMISGDIPYGTYNVASVNHFNDVEMKRCIFKQLGANEGKINDLLIKEASGSHIALTPQPYNLENVGYRMPSFEEGLARCMNHMKNTEEPKDKES